MKFPLLAICPSVLLLAALTAHRTSAVGPDPSPIEKQPNVILILADDLAIGDLAGGNGKSSRTPNLDQLASKSVRFTQAYSASCVCAPARAALLTGRYPHRTGVVTLNMNKYPKMTRIRRDETTLADALHEAGYSTGLVGKWHAGRGEGYHPLDRGFGHFDGFIGADDVGYFQYRFTQQRVTTTITDRYLTDHLTDCAIRLVRDHRGEPFFLHLAHYAPHRPLQAPSGIIRRYRDQGFDESTATIYAMIEVMDHGIGRLLRELDELQLADDTIVIFSSDNGPDPLTGERFNVNLRGTKYQVYEGGIRVPLFIRWGNRFATGERASVVSFVDVMPTILELCGVQLPTENPLDGESFAMVLRDVNTKFAPTRYWQWNRGKPNYTHNAAVREGDFKLVRPYVSRDSNIEDSQLPAVLYNLKADPTESTNVADQHPELFDRLKKRLRQWTESVEMDRERPARR